MVADGTTIHGTHVGTANIPVQDEDNMQTTLRIRPIYYVPGLHHRSFLTTAFQRDPNHIVSMSDNITRLHLRRQNKIFSIALPSNEPLSGFSTVNLAP